MLLQACQKQDYRVLLYMDLPVLLIHFLLLAMPNKCWSSQPSFVCYHVYFFQLSEFAQKFKNMHLPFIFPELMKPRSRGYITIRSANPYVHPVINPRFLSNPIDIAVLVEGNPIAFLSECSFFLLDMQTTKVEVEEPTSYVFFKLIPYLLVVGHWLYDKPVTSVTFLGTIYCSYRKTRIWIFVWMPISCHSFDWPASSPLTFQKFDFKYFSEDFLLN